MDLMFKHRSGATLWQGGMHDVEHLLHGARSPVQVIGLFALEYQPNDPSGRFELIKLGYHDSAALSPPVIEQVMSIANQASNTFSDRLRAGKSCLSSCAAGLNRSGLVTALTLMKVAGMAPDQAIQHIRESRKSPIDIGPLSNPLFVEIIHRMGPSTGAKRTWTRWSRSSTDVRH